MSKISNEDKIRAINLYLDGNHSQGNIASIFGVGKTSVQQWIHNYKSMGLDVFTRNKNMYYSKELKLQAVLEYLSGKGSQCEICEKYGILSKGQLQKWIKKYNSHEELKASRSGGTVIMSKGRKTTFEERVEIAAYCISHNHNYIKTANKYRVSYQQARNYTLKYENDGVDALQDRRGKRKPQDARTEIERLRAELKLEKAKREKAEMEASFLKKIDEIERRRG